MNPKGTVQYNSLSWVKKQLDAVLHDAQTSLSDYIEDIENTPALEQCIDHLRLVYGTLQMVEIYGAAMLAEEMELTARAQLDGLIERPDDAYDVLMRAMLQLPDYLEGLQAGNQDAPITLMPLMNDMRAARKEKLLSESVLFLPDVNAVEIEELGLDVSAIEPGKLTEEAKRLRTHYQLGLLDLLRNNKQAAGLKRMRAVIEALQKVTADGAVKRFWMVISALLESFVNDKNVANNIAAKDLFSGVDRQIKFLVDVGEDEFVGQFSQELLKNILYYIGTSKSTGPRIAKVKRAYKLDELLVDDSSSTDLSASMGGINAELFDTVSQGIREDLATVKDTLEIFMQSSDKDPEQLSSVVEQIEKIGDTYGMLGFGVIRQKVLDQRDEVQKIISGDSEVTEERVMEIASTLLEAESELDNYIAGKSGIVDTEAEEGQIVPTAEYRKVLATVVEEGQKNFAEAKDAIIVYASGNGDASHLETVIQRLEEVRGVCMMLAADRVSQLISGLKEYVCIALQNHQRQPDIEEQDKLADVVTSIEYYFEALSEGRPGVDKGLDAGEHALSILDEIVKQYPDDGAGDVDVVTHEETAAVVELAEEENIEAVSEEPEQDIETAIPDVELPLEEARIASPDVANVAVPEQYEEYEILSDDADDEIVEIFIEEAVEVLGSLHEYVPKWKENVNDEESLTVVRRNFHTLKGSGRLIGAALIGEFSWKIESLLNRLIEEKIEVGDDLFTLMDEVLAVLPQLIEQLRGNREPIPNIYQLMTFADALAEGRKLDSLLSEEAKEEITEEAVPEVIEAPVDEPEIEVSLNMDEVIELGDSLDIEDEEDVAIELSDDNDEFLLELADDLSEQDEVVLEISGDSDAIELTDLVDTDEHDDLNDLMLLVEDEAAEEEAIEESDQLEVFELADLEPSLEEDGLVVEIDVSDALADVEDISGLDMDPLLFQIYYDESTGHLHAIKDLFAKHESGIQRLEANNVLIRAFHTLFGSARTAEIEAIAEICSAAEKYVVAREDADDVVIPDDVITTIANVVTNVEAMLLELKSGSMPESNKPLLDKMNKAVQTELQQQLQQSSAVQELSEQKLTDSAHNEEEVELQGGDGEVTAEKEEALYTYGDVDDDLIDIFLEEAEELLEDCESTLARLHENEDDTASITELQRHMHTLKGGARMASLIPVGDITHELESMVVALAENKIETSKAFFAVLHESLDTLNGMLEMVKHRQALKSSDDLLERIKAVMRGETIEQRTVERFDIEVEDIQGDFTEDFFSEEPISIDEPEEEPVVIIEHDVASDEVEQVVEEPKRRKADVEEAKPHWGERATDVNFKDSQEQVRVRADLLNNLVNYAGEVNIHHARMGKQITDMGFNLKELDQTVVRLKEQLRKLEIETEIQIRSSYEKEADDYDENFDPLEMDRYSTLQQLARSLSETASDVDSIKDILSEIAIDSETLLLQESRISTDLQEGLMRTRMVRFGGMSTRLRRIVRQTSRELGKEVDVTIVGEEQEVDRTILDRVVAPLEHMLRNAVAHGIELPANRTAAGKQETGSIKITVGRQGTDVIVRVEDDGAGINADAIRRKAIKQGLLEENAELTDHDVLQFILKSGFSTAEEVTQVSGRGVGMDVVDSEIKQLGGVLEIDTIRGEGTSFRVRLPLTLAINQALLVDVGDDVYAVPLASIEGVVRITGAELQGFYDSGELEYSFNNVNYELKHLGALLTGQQADYADQHQLFPVLLVHVGDQHFALHVDDLLGRREIVIKPVGVQISMVRGIAGATILADGRVVLILEMSALVVGESLFKEITVEETEEIVDTEPTIMVVDDSITIRKVTARILERHGMKVMLATDGVDATGKLQEDIPDLMLLDIEMPRMDGFELATYMRNDERLKNIPIIMITSRTGTKHKERAKEIGVEQYLGKPYQEEELMRNINVLLDQA